MRYIALLCVFLFAVSVTARPRENRETELPVLKIIKRAVKSLGDGIIIPIPPPKP